MSVTTPDTRSPVRAAATVVLLRDGSDGLETFLIQRHDRSAVLGGVHVFPGGKLDPADTDPATLARSGAPIGELHARLGEPDLDPHTAAGLFVAACRETFEETGVLLAEPLRASRLQGARSLAARGAGFAAMLEAVGAAPAWDSLVPWSRWITPDLPQLFAHRFDARFFLARLPSGQEARHDDHEAVSGNWLGPRAILMEYWAGRIRLVPAQIVSLAALGRFDRVADALATARARMPPEIRMAPAECDGRPAVALPVDLRSLLGDSTLPLPSLFVYRNGRFEPPRGLAELLPSR